MTTTLQRRANQFQLSATPSTCTTRDIPPRVGRKVRLAHHPRTLIWKTGIAAYKKRLFSRNLHAGVAPRGIQRTHAPRGVRLRGTNLCNSREAASSRRAWEARARACCAVAHQPSNRDIIIRSRLRAFRSPGKLLTAQVELEQSIVPPRENQGHPANRLGESFDVRRAHPPPQQARDLRSTRRRTKQ